MNLLILTVCLLSQADPNIYIGMDDLVTLANGWTTTTDMDDFDELSINWQKPKTRMLIILPDLELNISNAALIGYYKSMKVPYKVLGAISATFANIQKEVKCGYIQYLFVNTHCNYVTPRPGTKVTMTELADGYIVSSSKYLLDNEYPNINSWEYIGFDHLCLAVFDGCYSGHMVLQNGQLVEGPPQRCVGMMDSDMSKALGIDKGVYFGWYNGFVSGVSSPYYQFACNFSGTLAEGKSVAEAIQYAINHDHGGAPSQEYRVYGHGDTTKVRVK